MGERVGQGPAWPLRKTRVRAEAVREWEMCEDRDQPCPYETKRLESPLLVLSSRLYHTPPTRLHPNFSLRLHPPHICFTFMVNYW
jgi:hypothetical protein